MPISFRFYSYSCQADLHDTSLFTSGINQMRIYFFFFKLKGLEEDLSFKSNYFCKKKKAPKKPNIKIDFSILYTTILHA